MFFHHSASKLKFGPELIWGYEMRLEVFLEQQLIATNFNWCFSELILCQKMAELVGYLGWSEFSLQAWREIPTNLA